MIINTHTLEKDAIQISIWREYAAIFEKRWGIRNAEEIGQMSKLLFAAEFMERGAAAYSDSVVLPIRNAWYSRLSVPQRWMKLKTMNIKDPILDFGCGVGFQLVFLKRIGFKRLYGHELPGVQHSIMKEMFKRHEIGVWKDGDRVETVLCFNVLEHVSDPVGFLRKLQSLGNRIIANVCLDTEDEPHIAPLDARYECAEILKKEAVYYGG